MGHPYLPPPTSNWNAGPREQVDLRICWRRRWNAAAEVENQQELPISCISRALLWDLCQLYLQEIITRVKCLVSLLTMHYLRKSLKTPVLYSNTTVAVPGLKVHLKEIYFNWVFFLYLEDHIPSLCDGIDWKRLACGCITWNISSCLISLFASQACPLSFILT